MAHQTVTINSTDWKKYEVILTASQDVNKGRLRIFLETHGPLDLEHISLFPADTWNGRENGMNTPGQNSNAVAELALGLMVFAVRNQYNGTSGTELKGKKLGIHACGNVGRNVARIAKGFGMDLYGFDAYCSAESMEKDGIKAVSSQEKLYQTWECVFK